MFSDRYQLKERLAASDGVDFYRALDISFPRNVFVTIFSDCDPTAVNSFRARAQSLAGLNHHHIMSIYDMECEGDSCYLISEYRECLTLRESLDKDRRFSLEEALFMALNIARAIAHAHENHVVHGQLSSEMIWLQGDDIKVAFVCPRTMLEWVPKQKQEDLLALGKILQELFAATPPLYKPEVREKVNEVVDRLLEKRLPFYTEASDLAHDLKMILTKDANPLYQTQIHQDLEQTRPYPLTSAEMAALAEKGPKGPIFRSLSKIRSSLLSYFAVSAGMLLLGLAASFFLANFQPESSYNMQSGIDKVPVNVAQAEETQAFSAITITPKEPISFIGKEVQGMPNLMGLEREEAEKLLLSKGLRYTYYLERSEMPQGIVYKQQPAPNHPFKPGDRVIFYVSDGK
jgi:serine/threonine protein kinase